MTPEEFDRLDWLDYQRLYMTMQRESANTQQQIEMMRRG